MSFFSKNWNPAFHKRREKRKKEEEPWVRTTRRLRSVVEPWDDLWKDYGCRVGSVHFTEMLRKFCTGDPIRDLEGSRSHRHPALHTKSVWLNDGQTFHGPRPAFPTLPTRTGYLTAYQFHQRLKLPVRDKNPILVSHELQS